MLCLRAGGTLARRGFREALSKLIDQGLEAVVEVEGLLDALERAIEVLEARLNSPSSNSKN